MEIYEELVHKYRTELVKFCMSCMNCDISSAEDVVQEVFLTLYKKKGINFDDNIRAWLYKTAKILIKKHMRQNPLHDDLSRLENTSDLSQEFYKDSIFDILTDEEREIIELCYMGADRQQVAQRYGITINALYCKVRRIKQKLKDNLSETNKYFSK